MEYEGADNQSNTNTAAAHEMLNNLKTELPKKPNKIKDLLEKIGKLPLFAGKRKFVILPILVIALAAAITVPILILTLPEPLTIEAWLENQQSSGAIYEANRAADAGDVDEALRILDDAINREQGNVERTALLKVEKSAIAANGDRSEIAIEVARNLVEINRERGDLYNLENSYAYLGGLYDDLGDEANALEAYLAAKAVADETGRRLNYIYYLERIAEITSEEVE